MRRRPQGHIGGEVAIGIYQQGQPIEITDTFRLDGIETNPTTVLYTIRAPDGSLTTYSWPGALEIANTAPGVFVLSLAPPALPGVYYYDVDSTGAVVASRSGDFTVLANVSAAVAASYAQFGPCTPWTDADDVWDCCGQPTTTVGSGTMTEEVCVDMAPFAATASQLLFENSGRVYAGLCQKTVRPCRTRDCGCDWQVLSRGHVVWSGEWWLCGEATPCGCRGLSRVRLSGYPVRAVSQVKIDGAVVSSSTYRLDERRYLTRVRDPADLSTVLRWPNCQSLDLPDTAEGTFSVTYTYGMDPPLAGQEAARQLACEIYKACSGADCQLPAGATRVTRQGVQIERQFFRIDPQTKAWRTGLTLVDAFLNAYNPQGLRRRPTIWSPASSQQYARPVGGG